MSRRVNNLKRMKEARKRRRMLRVPSSDTDAGKTENIRNKRDQMPGGLTEMICNSNDGEILFGSNPGTPLFGRDSSTSASMRGPSVFSFSTCNCLYTPGCVETIRMPVFFREASLPAMVEGLDEIRRDTTMKEQTMMKQFTHITLNNGHSCLVPAGKVVPNTVKVLWNLVKAGGGPIPVTKGLSFCLTSDDNDCCAFSIFKNSVPVLMCVYHEGSEKAESVWNNLLSNNVWCGIAQTMGIPHCPWLAVVLFRMAFVATGDLAMLAAFEQFVAETWRGLPVSKRSPIRSPALERIAKNLKSGNPPNEDGSRDGGNKHDDL